MIGPNTEIETGTSQALAPFDESLPVEEYRIHMDHDDVKAMAKHLGLDPADLHGLASRMEEWASSKGGVDREGLYRLSTCNPDGRWDWFEIGGRWEGYLDGQNDVRATDIAEAPSLKKHLPYCLLTPEGQWLECERFYVKDKKFKTEKFSQKKWLAIVREQLRRWPAHQVVCVDIHC